MAAGIKEIARQLNLGSSTVAYALSGKGTIAEATRQRVRAAAAELGYMPNRLAARMRSKRTCVIGLVMPDVVMAYNEFIQQVFRGAIARQYEVQIALTEFNTRLEDRAIRSLLESRVDGIILKSKFASLGDVPAGHALRQLVEQNIPAVVYGHPIAGTELATFATPALQTAEILTDHLLDLGRRDLAWLFPVEAPLTTLHLNRIEGSSRRLTARGLDPRVAMAIHTWQADSTEPEISPAHSTESRPGLRYDNYINQNLPRVGVRLGRSLMRRAMTKSPVRPTAVLCLNEVTAIGALIEARELGLRVPQDVAVVAAARTVATDLAPMTLTTADVSHVEAAGRALDLLFDTIDEKPDRPSVITSEPVLHVGHSSVAAPASEPEAAQRPTGARGFTLVELLVVIGIIALLISILLPALHKAQRAAKDVQCESNLRQIGAGALMYAHDWRGVMPRANTEFDPDPLNPGPRIEDWLKTIIPYIRPTADPLTSWTSEPLYECPRFNGDRTGMHATHYAMNMKFDLGASVAGNVKISQATRPTEIIMFADKTELDWAPLAQWYGNYIPVLRHGSGVRRQMSTVNRGVANAVFVDGHCATLTDRETTTQRLYDFDKN